MSNQSMENRRVHVMTVRLAAPYEAEIRNIRRQVFSDEQHIDTRTDFDGRDGEAWHVLIRVDGQYVATGRMLKDGHIGRLAVLEAWRGRGLGRRAIEALIAAAAAEGIRQVWLAAQQQAVGFYERLGFQPVGGLFRQVGIMHCRMIKAIESEQRHE